MNIPLPILLVSAFGLLCAGVSAGWWMAKRKYGLADRLTARLGRMVEHEGFETEDLLADVMSRDQLSHQISREIALESGRQVLYGDNPKAGVGA